MSSAFDTIDHSILFQHLKNKLGINYKLLDWFTSYLNNRSQAVFIQGVTSTNIAVEFGVAQGSILGPIEYIVYTSPLAEIITKYDLRYHFYANDGQLCL